MENIFTQRNAVISSFIVPWILGVGCRTPEQAKKYINYGKTLNPKYYPVNKEDIDINGEESVYLRFMERLFNENNIDSELSQIVGEKVYKPWDCLSGIYQVKINDKMGLVAKPNGITQNNECVVLVDDFLFKFYKNDIEEELTLKLIATMAVWKAKKGLYIIKKMKKNIYIEFDNSKWEKILYKIQLWSDTTQVNESVFPIK